MWTQVGLFSAQHLGSPVDPWAWAHSGRCSRAAPPRVRHSTGHQVSSEVRLLSEIPDLTHQLSHVTLKKPLHLLGFSLFNGMDGPDHPPPRSSQDRRKPPGMGTGRSISPSKHPHDSVGTRHHLKCLTRVHPYPSRGGGALTTPFTDEETEARRG